MVTRVKRLALETGGGGIPQRSPQGDFAGCIEAEMPIPIGPVDAFQPEVMAFALDIEAAGAVMTITIGGLRAQC